MNKYRRTGIQIAISASVGIIVAALAIVVAWRNIRAMREVRLEQWTTRQAILEIDELIKWHHGATKAPPRSLEELPPPDGFEVHFLRDERGRPLDGWGHPFLYSTDGTTYVITSLGRDGKPGGLGLDYDLSNTNEWPAEAQLTFRQFLTRPITRPSVSVCFVCGLLAFLLSFRTVHPSALHGRAIVPLIVKLAFTILGTLAASAVMTVLHVPSGH